MSQNKAAQISKEDNNNDKSSRNNNKVSKIVAAGLFMESESSKPIKCDKSL